MTLTELQTKPDISYQYLRQEGYANLRWIQDTPGGAAQFMALQCRGGEKIYCNRKFHLIQDWFGRNRWLDCSCRSKREADEEPEPAAPKRIVNMGGRLRWV